jgi:protein subunit release factor B
MNKFGVRHEKEGILLKRMRELSICEGNIEETFIHSRGSGSQNVNKTSTCVQLRHIPTGIVVKEQRRRSHGLNRFLAHRLLVSKIEERILGRKSADQLKGEKNYKQKKRRYRRAKKKLTSITIKGQVTIPKDKP